MGVEKIRRRLVAQVVDERDKTAYLPVQTTALTAAILGTATDGNIKVGRSLGTIQIGIVVNGSAFILSGTAGGAVTLVAAP